MYILNDGECELTAGGDPTSSYSYGTGPMSGPPVGASYITTLHGDLPNGYYTTTYSWSTPGGDSKTWTETIGPWNGYTNVYEAVFTDTTPWGSVSVIDKKYGY